MAVDTQGYFSVIDTFKPPALTVTPELKYIYYLFSFYFIPFYCRDVPSTSPCSRLSLAWWLQQRFHGQGRNSGFFRILGRAAGVTTPVMGTGAEPLHLPRTRSHHPSDGHQGVSLGQSLWIYPRPGATTPVTVPRAITSEELLDFLGSLTPAEHPQGPQQAGSSDTMAGTSSLGILVVTTARANRLTERNTQLKALIAEKCQTYPV